MADDSVKVEFVEGLSPSERRAVAWITRGDEFNAKTIFENLASNSEGFVRASMDAWIGGAPDIHGRFHGFPGDKTFVDGYVFKYRENRLENRLYGFKMRPGVPDGQFDICVLAVHATKAGKYTPDWVKSVVGRLRDDEAIRRSVVKRVAELYCGKNKRKGRTRK